MVIILENNRIMQINPQISKYSQNTLETLLKCPDSLQKPCKYHYYCHVIKTNCHMVHHEY